MTNTVRVSMTFRWNRKNSGLWKSILLGIIIPFFLLPFIHYHPETAHSHSEDADAHQHQGRYHSATLEAYAHLVNGHFSNHELDDHFHHAHSSEEYDESDSGFFILAKYSKPFKQGLAFKQVGHPIRFEISNPLVFILTSSETVSFQPRFSRNTYSSRSPPAFLI